jgi:hypothetical protein
VVRADDRDRVGGERDPERLLVGLLPGGRDSVRALEIGQVVQGVVEQNAAWVSPDGLAARAAAIRSTASSHVTWTMHLLAGDGSQVDHSPVASPSARGGWASAWYGFRSCRSRRIDRRQELHVAVHRVDVDERASVPRGFEDVEDLLVVRQGTPCTRRKS